MPGHLAIAFVAIHVVSTRRASRRGRRASAGNDGPCEIEIVRHPIRGETRAVGGPNAELNGRCRLTVGSPERKGDAHFEAQQVVNATSLRNRNGHG